MDYRFTREVQEKIGRPHTSRKANVSTWVWTLREKMTQMPKQAHTECTDGFIYPSITHPSIIHPSPIHPIHPSSIHLSSIHLSSIYPSITHPSIIYPSIHRLSIHHPSIYHLSIHLLTWSPSSINYLLPIDHLSICPSISIHIGIHTSDIHIDTYPMGPTISCNLKRIL